MGIILSSGFSLVISVRVSPLSQRFFFSLLRVTEHLCDMEENTKENKNTILITLGYNRKIEELV